LAAIAGAQFVSPYLGRMEDHHINAFSLLEEMLDIIDIHMFPLKLLAASIRSKEQIIKCAKLGVPAITIPEAAYKLLLSTHELTTASLEEFNLHWRDGKHTKDSKIF
jgi:transaldolase